MRLVAKQVQDYINNWAVQDQASVGVIAIGVRDTTAKDVAGADRDYADAGLVLDCPVVDQGKALGWMWSGLLGLPSSLRYAVAGLSNAAMGQKPPAFLRTNRTIG